MYERALAIELQLRGLPFERQKRIGVFYKGEPVGDGRLDFLVAGRLILELKALRDLHPTHTAVVLSYLKATNLQLALLINFSVAKLKTGVQRVVYSPD